MKTILPRALIVAALIWFGFVLFHETRVMQTAEHADQTKVVYLFIGIVLLAVIAGMITALSLVPAIGDWIGDFFFNPNEQIEHDPHSEALAKIAQGDYEGAIASYLEIFENDPSDTHALSEAAKLYCEKSGDPESAAALLERALQNEWAPEQGTFLANRLVDVYWNFRGDSDRACALLSQIIETLPDTKYSANAQHRLQEIHRAAMTAGEIPALPAAEEEQQTEG